VVPVNLGGLGFLTAAEESELDPAVDAALAGEWPVLERRLIGVRTMPRRGPSQRAYALNDAVVRSGGGQALHLRLAVLGSDLGHQVADGVVCASAAGSTAYSLSAGGPVLAPEAAALLVTPVCAHSLGTRSLVLAPKDNLTVRVIGSTDRMSLLLDGHEHFELLAGDALVFRLVPDALRIVDNPERPFARALRDKLGWQGSARRSF
jgi:NAD+ kinase